jgi:molecular chaperone GrpE
MNYLTNNELTVMSKQKQDNNDTKEEKKPEVTIEEFETMQTELQTLQENFESVNGQFKRALADYQNLEKRVAEGRSEMNSWAVNDLLRQIAQVMHYFDQAFKGVSEEEQQSNWFKGVKMANLQLAQVLQNAGLEEIETDGQFDPALHEAVDTKDGEDGKILEVVEKGYKLNGKILKPARVIVGKKE